MIAEAGSCSGGLSSRERNMGSGEIVCEAVTSQRWETGSCHVARPPARYPHIECHYDTFEAGRLLRDGHVRSADSAIEAMGHRAYEYLLKPIDMKKLDRVINEALKTLRLNLRDLGLSVCACAKRKKTTRSNPTASLKRGSPPDAPGRIVVVADIPPSPVDRLPDQRLSGFPGGSGTPAVLGSRSLAAPFASAKLQPEQGLRGGLSVGSRPGRICRASLVRPVALMSSRLPLATSANGFAVKSTRNRFGPRKMKCRSADHRASRHAVT